MAGFFKIIRRCRRENSSARDQAFLAQQKMHPDASLSLPCSHLKNQEKRSHK